MLRFYLPLCLGRSKHVVTCILNPHHEQVKIWMLEEPLDIQVCGLDVRILLLPVFLLDASKTPYRYLARAQVRMDHVLPYLFDAASGE